MTQELFDIGEDMAVNCNPGGRFHGWLFKKHPDGLYVSIRKLEVIESDPFFFHAQPKADACEHDFQGWREIDGGRGGEQFCKKCGMGAMEHTLRTGP